MAADVRTLAETGPLDYPFACQFRVRYSEIDGQSIVFNAHYLTYYDTALGEFFRHVGIVYGQAQDADGGVDFHTVRNLIDYHAPVRLDELITVHVRVGRMGRSSISFDVALFAEGEDRPRNSGEVVWVCAGIGDHRSRPIPEHLRTRLEASEGGPRVVIDPVSRLPR